MPQVPYKPFPTAQPYERGSPMLNISTPGAAFGTEVGQAISGLGRGLEEAGKEQFTAAAYLKGLENDAIVSKAKADNIQSQGIASEEFGTRMGLDAGPEPLKAHIAGLEAKRQAIEDGLPNEDAKHRFRAESLQVMRSYVVRAVGHSVAETKKAQAHGIEGEMDAIIESEVHNAADFTNTKKNLDDFEGMMRRSEAYKGMPKEQFDQELLKRRSNLLTNKLAALAGTQPQEAMRLSPEWAPYMNHKDLLNLQDHLENRMEVNAAQNVANKFKDSDLSEGERVEKAIEEAQKYGTGTRWFNRVRDNVIKDFNREQAVKRDDNRLNMGYVSDGVYGNYSNGQIPTEQQFYNLPIPGTNMTMADVVKKLEPKDRNAIAGRLKRMQDSVTKAENERNGKILEAMARDPETLPDFLEQDYTKWGLNDVQIRHFDKLRKEKLKNPTEDVRVKDIMQDAQIKAKLIDLKWTKTDGGEKGQMDNLFFQQSLRDAIQLEQKANNAPLTYERRKTIAMNLMTQSITERGWFWDTKKTLLERMRDMTPQAIQGIRDKMMKDNPYVYPTDQDILSDMFRARALEMHDELYGRPTPGAK